MRLNNEDTDDGLELVPGSHGINVPSACTIVIIAGITIIQQIETRKGWCPIKGGGQQFMTRLAVDELMCWQHAKKNMFVLQANPRTPVMAS